LGSRKDAILQEITQKKKEKERAKFLSETNYYGRGTTANTLGIREVMVEKSTSVQREPTTTITEGMSKNIEEKKNWSATLSTQGRKEEKVGELET